MVVHRPQDEPIIPLVLAGQYAITAGGGACPGAGGNGQRLAIGKSAGAFSHQPSAASIFKIKQGAGDRCACILYGFTNVAGDRIGIASTGQGEPVDLTVVAIGLDGAAP